MMRILFLDDDPLRHGLFRHWNIGSTVVWAKTAAEAIRMLGDGSYDLISLDHDLLERHYVAGMRGEPMDEATTGMAVARHIAANAKRYAGASIVVHSLNQTGSRAMAFVMRHAGLDVALKPFGLG